MCLSKKLHSPALSRGIVEFQQHVLWAHVLERAMERTSKPRRDLSARFIQLSFDNFYCRVTHLVTLPAKSLLDLSPKTLHLHKQAQARTRGSHWYLDSKHLSQHVRCHDIAKTRETDMLRQNSESSESSITLTSNTLRDDTKIEQEL